MSRSRASWRFACTGRAGAKGRAFTLVTPEDAEAIGNVEKLTGMTIPVFDLGGGAQEARENEPARAERPKRERGGRDRPRRETREADEPKVREPAPQPVERVAEAPRKAPTPEPRKAEKPRAEPADADDGEWNGPVPGFLGLSAL